MQSTSLSLWNISGLGSYLSLEALPRRTTCLFLSANRTLLPSHHTRHHPQPLPPLRPLRQPSRKPRDSAPLQLLMSLLT